MYMLNRGSMFKDVCLDCIMISVRSELVFIVSGVNISVFCIIQLHSVHHNICNASRECI